MKYLLLFSILFYTLSSSASTSDDISSKYHEAAFFSFGGEKVVKVADFPDSAEFMNIEGRHFDAGIIYKQFSVFFIPLWNYDARWCAYLSSDMYIEMGKSELDEFAEEAKVTLPEEIELSFWDKIGGKLLAGSLFIIYMMIPSDESQE